MSSAPKRPQDGVVGLAVLFGFLLLGEGLSRALPLGIPGSVLGMLALTLALLIGVVKLHWVESAADALLARMSLFFVPPGVGVLVYFDLIRREFLPLSVSILLSTLIVLAVTGHAAQLTGNLWRRLRPPRPRHEP